MLFRHAVDDIVEKHRQDIIDFLQLVVQTPSPTGSEEACARIIRDKLEELGLQVTWVEPEPGRPNVIGRLEGTAPGPRFLFNGHIDTVPPGPMEEWEFDPYSGHIADGRLYGRGACDMKAGLVAMIFATGLLGRLGTPPQGSVTITAVCDEQRGSELGTGYLINNGYINHHMGIVGEPTDLRVDIGHKGVFWAKLRTTGKSAHGSRPWRGVNAIEHMHVVMTHLRKHAAELMQREDPLLGPATLNLAMMEAGTSTNMVPAHCTLIIDRRLVYGETKEQVLAELQQVIDEARTEVPDLRCTLEVIRHMPPAKVERDADVVKALIAEIEAVSGEAPPVRGKDAGTDAWWLTNFANMPAVVFGPGDYRLASLAANEFVGLDDVITAVKIYMLTAARSIGWFDGGA